MTFITREEDAGVVVELDEDGITFLEEGLAQLRASDPGCVLTVPSLDCDRETREPTGVGQFVLRRL